MKKGMIVEIKNTTIDGREIVEGKAKLIKRKMGYGSSERWTVHFLNDPAGVNYDRNVENCKETNT